MLFAVGALLVVVAFSGSYALAENNADGTAAAAALRKLYPNSPVGEVSKTDIDGLYEVVSGGNIIYFHPKTGTIFTGDMIRGGKSLTQARLNEISAKFLKDLPMEKSLRVGKGKKEIIEFSDTDCPYCRKADEYLAKRTDVTIRLFLYPLPNHPDARKKSLKILCSTDSAAAYRDAMVGKLDGNFALPDGCEAKKSALLEEHIAWGKKLGVSGTPAFWINGEKVNGYDVQRLEQLLSDKR